MSKKTIKQRIALVAALALGTGVLSVAPANAGTLAAADVSVVAIGTQAGICKISNSTGAKSAVVVSGYSFAVQVANGVDTSFLETSGNVTVASITSGFDSATATTVSGTDSASSDIARISAGAVGTGKVSFYTASGGTLKDVVSVTVVAACASDIVSLSKSYVQVIAIANAQDNTASASNVDVTAELEQVNGESAYIGVALADAYSNPLSSGALVATVTSGDAFVNAAEAYASGAAVSVAAGKTKTAVLSTTGQNAQIRVSQSVADKPATAVVSITFNGTLVATKTIKLQGIAASIEIKDVTVGTTGTVGYFRAKVKDAAGNDLRSKDVANDATANSVAAISAITTGVTQAATTASDGDWSPAAGAGSDGRFNCTKGGVTTLNVLHVADAATTIKKSFAIACGGALDTWTISMDKASYAPGEIATLTVTGKDSLGNLVNSALDIGTVEYSFGGMTFVTAPTTTDSFTSAAGAKTYQLSVGTSLGSYVGTFKIAGSTDTSAKTVQYSVKSSTTTVTNEDVLKSIVALIASINKQIQALQKLILKR
jgi:hypothetical protein